MRHPIFLTMVTVVAFLLSVLAVGAAELRELTSVEHREWQAIGRVSHGSLETDSLCTGALIAPDWVLTAAHCVLGVKRPQNVFFAAGWYKGMPVTARRGTEIVIDPRRNPQEPLTMSQLPFDVALIRLEQPINNVAPLAIGALLSAEAAPPQLAYVSYSNLRPDVLSGQFPCIAAPAPEAVIFTDCPVTGGNSGAPVLQQMADGWKVVGVVSAQGPNARVASIAVVPQSPLLSRLDGQ